MTVRANITTKGLEEWLDDAADRALEAGAAVAVDGMQTRVAVLTGNLKSNISTGKPERDGNFHFVEVGLLQGTDADTARYGNVQEFGSANTPAHPYIRPAMDEDKRKILAAERESLKADGTL
jgi:HK97 gp10 family phage protein